MSTKGEGRRELGQELISHERVRESILANLPRLDTETVGLLEASGRVLAEEIRCEEPVPAFDSSAMDGFAVLASDLEGASQGAPVVLPVVSTLAAGDSGDLELASGQAIRIMTGAPLPRGADAVVPHELTSFTPSEVSFRAPVPAGKNVRSAGGDMRAGCVALEAGLRLRASHIAVAAALGRGRIPVRRRPLVAIISPGAELVEPWETPGPGQVRNSNAYALAALVAEAGGMANLRGIVTDDPQAIRRALRSALHDGADLILTTGGVSAGDYDHVHRVVCADGDPAWAFKTDLRPGKPLVFGRLHGVPVMGLPGNPAAAVVSFVVFARPALRVMMSVSPALLPDVPVRFPEPYRYRTGRVFMLRARIEPDPRADSAGYRVASAGSQDSSFLHSLAAANALVRLPADRGEVAAGEVFPAQWIHAP